ncbi:hypothetical protein HA402_012546 [Bradysia odoriphaga]|nr:hypothetical protein HA402_012546 [Bradysia odoriphaga]
MKALQIVIFIYTLVVTSFFIVYSFYDYDLNTTIRQARPTNAEAYIGLAKTYPKYYDSNLHVEWPFNITKQYNESDVREWSEMITQSKLSSGIGEGGSAFVPPDNMKELMEKLHKENNYNLLASEMMSLHRSLPDPRYNECKNLSYPRKLPTTSVIIIFHNEAWTTLLRTVWSVIDRSPDELIKEIILVDDLSTWSFLKRPLDDYIETIPVRIKLIRNTKREGLIRARLIGAQHAENRCYGMYRQFKVLVVFHSVLKSLFINNNIDMQMM